MNFPSSFTTQKALGRQYLCAGIFFLLLGYGMIVFIRKNLFPGSDLADCFREIHGTIMVFFGIGPIAFASLGYYILPELEKEDRLLGWLDRGALILFYLSAVLVLVSLFSIGTCVWLLAMGFNLAFAVACSGDFIWRIGRDFFKPKMPLRFLAGGLFITALFLLIDFVLLEVATIMQLVVGFQNSDFSFHSHSHSANDSVPILWRHLFWFMGHPEVFMIFIPVFGFLAEGLQGLIKVMAFKLKA